MKQGLTRSSLLLGIAMGMLAVSNIAVAAGGDAAAGARKAIFCAYCHGADGNPTDGNIPRLAGQSARSLVVKMKHQVPYQDMQHPMMRAFITGGVLNDQDIENLAAYFAKQPIRLSATPHNAARASN